MYFVGGVTFAEIAALRFLNQQKNAKVRYIIATTSVINGNRCMDEMRTGLENALDPVSLIKK